MHNPLRKIWVPRCLGRLLYLVLYATKELEEGSGSLDGKRRPIRRRREKRRKITKVSSCKEGLSSSSSIKPLHTQNAEPLSVSG